MWRFFTSLTFLYLLTGLAILLFALFQYRDFKAGRVRKWRFVALFSTVALACMGFLWLHFHAPLGLKTYTNLDHHFLEHPGFVLRTKLMLGGADTSNNKQAPYNEFWFSGNGEKLSLNSPYHEEPAYSGQAGHYRLLSKGYEAEGHAISITGKGIQLKIRGNSDQDFELQVGKAQFSGTQKIRKGIRVWDVFRNDSSFANQALVNDLELAEALQQIYLVRSEFGNGGTGSLVFFISSKLFRPGYHVSYDNSVVTTESQHLLSEISSGTLFAWGISFSESNKNQFRIVKKADKWNLLYRYPLAYPLSEAEKSFDAAHTATRFLLNDPAQFDQLSAVFREGFLFRSPDYRIETGFAPLLLQYQQGRYDQSLQLLAQSIDQPGVNKLATGDSIFLGARNGSVDWIFRVRNSFDWNLGGSIWSAGRWQLFIFGSLLIFALLILFDAYLRSPESQNFVLQVLSVLMFAFISTRFFLYWRYKSFPPFEGLDLPAEQQLNSSGNFLIIVGATLLLAVLFSKKVWQWLAAKFRLPGRPAVSGLKANLWQKPTSRLRSLLSRPVPFLLLWAVILLAAMSVSWFAGSNSGINRHLAIGLVLLYFVFLFLSYKHSPLSAERSKAWWQLQTHRSLQLLFNNPVKIILSFSLLVVFGLIDIGFSIVFLNFLLFNEAFLFINYAIGGLSAGSKQNARMMAILGAAYLVLFIINLLFAPYIFSFLLQMPTTAYVLLFGIGGAFAGWLLQRLSLLQFKAPRFTGSLVLAGFFAAAALFVFPKEKVLEKAASTQFRINVLTQPLDEALTVAYSRGANYIPVIRAAQNQWFINTFVDSKHNPAANSASFTLLPHAPQNKGARYNAQATDLVSSRFLMAEHGKSSVFFYVCLLMLPAIVLASFYKLYPDFTNRINQNYASVTAGFAILNYLLVTALMVVLAATGRYIFFGQDLPFGSILSKQSLLFPIALLMLVVWFFGSVQAERFASRKKWLPGISLLAFLFVLLFFVNPAFNRQKEFTVPGLASSLEDLVESRLQPLLDYFDTSRATRRLSVADKDRLFCDSLRKQMRNQTDMETHPFFWKEARKYAFSGHIRHRDQRQLLYLDPNSNGLQLAVNDRFFRVEPPPHLQALWKGDVLSDTTVVNLTIWDAVQNQKIVRTIDRSMGLSTPLEFNGFSLTLSGGKENDKVVLTNNSPQPLLLRADKLTEELKPGASLTLPTSSIWEYGRSGEKTHGWIGVHPDAFMRNYLVNGSRYYYYPLGERFIWARNFAEAVSVDFSERGQLDQHAYLSIDYSWTDSLTRMMSDLMDQSPLFASRSGYGITVADADGRILAMADHIRDAGRVNPNDKAAFLNLLRDEEGKMKPSDWRRYLGNLNLLRMNPGPGSTLKPIVFAAVASQLSIDWNQFASTGFSEKQKLFGGMKVPEYDFELNNGRVGNVADYIRLSDNYYHSNLLLLGSYRKQPLEQLLRDKFSNQVGPNGFWPRLEYAGRNWYMYDFRNWPGYEQGMADFGSDSSFVNIGLWRNFGISNNPEKQASGVFRSHYDSTLLGNLARQSGFVMPEWSLFDQKALGLDHRIPYDLFLHSFRGHVKGSSQVLISPVGMVHALGRLASQNAGYSLSLNPHATVGDFRPFDVDPSISYNDYLGLMRSELFRGMRAVLERGTAAGLGRQLKQGGPYYYFAKTGTTGDDEKRTKSKLMALIISESDLSSDDHVFRNNKFIMVYFTCQDGPPVQQEEFQARVIRYLESSQTFRRYMTKGKD